MANNKTQTFTNKCFVLYGNLYDYSLVYYKNAQSKVNIICPIHGQFEKTPNNHLRGQGCPQCSSASRLLKILNKYGTDNPSKNLEVQQKRKSTNLIKYGTDNPLGNDDIRKKRKQTMLDNYGVEYSYSNPNLYLKCKQTMLDNHGVTHNSYIPEVVNKRKQTMLVKYGVSQFNQQHMIDILPLLTNQEWLFDQYIIQNKTAIQISNELGISDVTIGLYLKQHEISIRQIGWCSYKSQVWLDNINDNIIREYKIPGTKFRADGYCKETNTIYEFYGDYWHGNPEIYNPEDINEVNGKTMGELYQNTIERERKLAQLGYVLISMWENKFII